MRGGRGRVKEYSRKHSNAKHAPAAAAVNITYALGQLTTMERNMILSQGLTSTILLAAACLYYIRKAQRQSVISMCAKMERQRSKIQDHGIAVDGSMYQTPKRRKEG